MSSKDSQNTYIFVLVKGCITMNNVGRNANCNTVYSTVHIFLKEQKVRTNLCLICFIN